MPEIQKANPAERKKSLLILLAGIVLGVALLSALQCLEQDIQTWVAANLDYIQQHPYLVLTIALLFTSPLLVASGYLFVYARCVISTQRLPPAGHQVIRDTIVHTGSAAIIRARVMQILALIIMLATLAIPLLLWRVLNLVLTAA